jgi:hypothetical protein
LGGQSIKEISFSKHNIKNGFKVIKIWHLNPRAMDNRTKFNKVYITTINMKILNENNHNASDDDNDYQIRGKYGGVEELVNIASITKVTKT